MKDYNKDYIRKKIKESAYWKIFIAAGIMLIIALFNVIESRKDLIPIFVILLLLDVVILIFYFLEYNKCRVCVFEGIVTNHSVIKANKNIFHTEMLNFTVRNEETRKKKSFIISKGAYSIILSSKVTVYYTGFLNIVISVNKSSDG